MSAATSDLTEAKCCLPSWVILVNFSSDLWNARNVWRPKTIPTPMPITIPAKTSIGWWTWSEILETEIEVLRIASIMTIVTFELALFFNIQIFLLHLLTCSTCEINLIDSEVLPKRSYRLHPLFILWLAPIMAKSLLRGFYTNQSIILNFQ